jgi:hypothetical protein
MGEAEEMAVGSWEMGEAEEMGAGSWQIGGADGGCWMLDCLGSSERRKPQWSDG